ncbi:hypothetical protein Poli38472_012585 [Pythium oligandrum]|uniref:FYVE-type domain-containing protein n=1 Tax=Pythium oligandrum TaxID=41045 RepID=A0A8K1FHU7_PYTOL|nr:hypothetical protein Poli38472_012585 [Pythium oligandrum]|eukprot:TMW61394.1 hypothetical protein Poli38472_012585 [Pythium oligandrum]
MTRHLPPFGTLKLTREEEFAARQQASEVIQRTLALEIEYRRQGTAVDTKEWKKVSTVDDFHVYKQRRAVRRRSDPPIRRDTTCSVDIATPELFSVRDDSSTKWRDSTIAGSESTLDRSPSSWSASSGNEPRVPRILCTGNVEGNLEDFMYGVYDGDDDAWRLRAAYIKDKFDEARILATIEGPSKDDPFRFLGIKWFTTAYPPVVGSFIQKRDTLVIESMGIAKDEHGVPYGYYIMDDYAHSNLPDRSEYGLLRNKFSMCFIHRQLAPNRIGEYARGFVDSGGNVPPAVTISIASISLSSVTNGVETAYNKKLALLMASERGRRRAASAAPSSVCESCHKSAHGVLSRSLVDCHVCGHLFCGKCIVERKLIVDTQSCQMSSRALPFCFACILRAKQLSSADLMLTPDSKKQ